MLDRLWHQVLKYKYFPFVYVAHWLQTISVIGEKGSQSWKYLLKSLHILLHWLAWCPGMGESILIGKIVSWVWGTRPSCWVI
jgi:hypothetical protein